jgi:hypothetical protein
METQGQRKNFPQDSKKLQFPLAFWKTTVYNVKKQNSRRKQL